MIRPAGNKSGGKAAGETHELTTQPVGLKFASLIVWTENHPERASVH